jgi:hypothetical protein
MTHLQEDEAPSAPSERQGHTPWGGRRGRMVPSPCKRTHVRRFPFGCPPLRHRSEASFETMAIRESRQFAYESRCRGIATKSLVAVLNLPERLLFMLPRTRPLDDCLTVHRRLQLLNRGYARKVNSPVRRRRDSPHC